MGFNSGFKGLMDAEQYSAGPCTQRTNRQVLRLMREAYDNFCYRRD